MLFGSRAQGMAWPTSDYALAVFLDDATCRGGSSHSKKTFSGQDVHQLLAVPADLQHRLRTSRVDQVPLT